MPRGQNLVQSRELPYQEPNGKLFGEDYDDPFQGMEPIFGLETSGTEDVSPENNEAEEIEKAQGIPREDYEKKKTELLKKIKSFGLATAPLDNLSGTKKEKSLKSSEEEVRVKSSETPASPEVPKTATATAATKDLKPADQINEGNGRDQAGGEGVKRKAKKTKAVNPLVKRQKTKISKAKKLQ